jgi:6-phosphogluconolactonase (cycloisomerase 2 family)
MTAGAPTRLYLGCYTAGSGGHGQGISVFERGEIDEPWRLEQVAGVSDPSFLALTEGAVHAVSETTAGRVVSFTVSAGQLVPASVAASGGSSPCHIALDPASGAIVVANYGAGTLAVLSADAFDEARVARVLPLPGGSGPVVDRQEGPHTHSVTATPWGTLLLADLGTDRLVEVRVDPITLEPHFVAVHPMPSGSGPRHLAWWGSSLLVAGELDGRVHVMSYTDGVLEVDYSVASYDVRVNHGTGEALLSHIEVYHERVYVAVRGRDTVAVLAKPESAAPETNRLTLVGEVPCGGRWPRHFAIAPSLEGADLYVANQMSDTVSILALDAITGIPRRAMSLIETGSPSCVVFA